MRGFISRGEIVGGRDGVTTREGLRKRRERDSIVMPNSLLHQESVEAIKWPRMP
jgi:hypothetical protein